LIAERAETRQALAALELKHAAVCDQREALRRCVAQTCKNSLAALEHMQQKHQALSSSVVSRDYALSLQGELEMLRSQCKAHGAMLEEAKRSNAAMCEQLRAARSQLEQAEAAAESLSAELQKHRRPLGGGSKRIDSVPHNFSEFADEVSSLLLGANGSIQKIMNALERIAATHNIRLPASIETECSPDSSAVEDTNTNPHTERASETGRESNSSGKSSRKLPWKKIKEEISCRCDRLLIWSTVLERLDGELPRQPNKPEHPIDGDEHSFRCFTSQHLLDLQKAQITAQQEALDLAYRENRLLLEKLDIKRYILSMRRRNRRGRRRSCVPDSDRRPPPLSAEHFPPLAASMPERSSLKIDTYAAGLSFGLEHQSHIDGAGTQRSSDTEVSSRLPSPASSALSLASTANLELPSDCSQLSPFPSLSPCSPAENSA